jgi:hypothetical protein
MRSDMDTILSRGPATLFQLRFRFAGPNLGQFVS